MGIPQGVTLIVGGGFHGKSTLLRAIERGIYNHKPGDGREKVVSLPETIKIRAEDGRSIAGVDISPFINGLPFDIDTTQFSTQLASGSTSQAANIMEALEMGAKVLLIDEDTAATNFMIRDRRMQALVAKGKEPITPYIDRARQLFAEYGVSSVLVIGGSGDYLDIADTVILMDTYRPYDVTAKAREVAQAFPTGRLQEARGPFHITPRMPLPTSITLQKGRKTVVKPVGTQGLRLGNQTVDVQALTALVEPAQLRAIGWAIHYALQKGYLDGQRTFADIARLIMEDVAQQGLEILTPTSYPTGDLAAFRPLEWAGVLHRLRTLKVRQTQARAPS